MDRLQQDNLAVLLLDAATVAKNLAKRLDDIAARDPEICAAIEAIGWTYNFNSADLTALAEKLAFAPTQKKIGNFTFFACNR